MSRINDVGGVQGFGAIPVAHKASGAHEWGKRVAAINAALVRHGLYTFHEFRDAVERQEPRAYLSSTYYERRLRALETLVEERVRRKAAARRTDTPSSSLEQHLPPLNVGARVRVSNDDPLGYCRTPRYIRGRVGTVMAERGPAVSPGDQVNRSSAARSLLVYSVAFQSAALWGASGDPHVLVFVDVWHDSLHLITDTIPEEGSQPWQ